MSNKKELLQKIKVLAERGVDGEKENAQMLLDRLIERYGITEDELETELCTMHWFSFSQKIEKRLLCQIIYMVTGLFPYSCINRSTNRTRKKVGIECTAAERIEIEMNYTFFKDALYSELDIFMSAFANKNSLFPPPDKVKDKNDDIPEDINHSLKVSFMAEGMEKHTLKKALTEQVEQKEVEI